MTPFGIRKRTRALLDKAVAFARDAQARSKPRPVATSLPTKKERNWETSSQADLVDYLVSRYHDALRRDLPALVEAAGALEREQATHPSVPRGLADTLAALRTDLEAHMLHEETSLFPTLRDGARGGPLDMELRMMGRDHEGHTASLGRIRKQTGGLQAPTGASAAWAKLYADLGALEADLRQHMYLEDAILFARAAGAPGS